MNSNLLRLDLVRPGDCLLYDHNSWVDTLIKIKTWSPCAHVEIYEGHGESVASRNGIGVGRYPSDVTGLVAILRPKTYPDLAKSKAWFETVDGEGYDWKGLLCFALAVKQGAQDKMFCSEFAARWYRSAGINVFNPRWDADKIAPGDFLQSAEFDWEWWNF